MIHTKRLQNCDTIEKTWRNNPFYKATVVDILQLVVEEVKGMRRD